MRIRPTIALWVVLAVVTALVRPHPAAAEHRTGAARDATLMRVLIRPDVDELPVGFSAQFRAIGRFSDGEERDVTEDVDWAVRLPPGDVGPPPLQVDNTPGRKGFVHRLSPGEAIVVATHPATMLSGEVRFPQEILAMCEFVEGIFSLVFEQFGKGCRGVKSELRQVAIENDVLGPKNQDRFYTNGTFYEQAYFGELPPGAGRRDNYGFRIGQYVYTAARIQSAQPVPDKGDRPFAGYLYFGVFWESFRRDLKWLDYLRLDAEVGCTGPCSMAETAQTLAHDLISVVSDTPQGWRSQIKEEVGLNFRGTYAPFTLAIKKDADTHWVDLLPMVQGEIGSFFVNESATLLGRVSIIGGLLPYIHTGSLDSAATAAESANRRFRLHAFGRTSAKKVQRNALLQGGQFHRREDNIFTADPDDTVHESALGLQMGFGSFAFSYTVTQRSSEVKGPRGSLADEGHYFGKLQFNWVLDLP